MTQGSNRIDDRPADHDGRTAFALELQRVFTAVPCRILPPDRKKTAKGGIGIAFRRPKRIPRLRPRIQTKVALQVSMPGFAVAGMQADGT